jgi:hypothetical protein
MVFAPDLVVRRFESERCRALLRANAGPFNLALYVGALRREQRVMRRKNS